MFRTAILRSVAAATRTAMRPVPSASVRRLAIAPAPRTASFVPKTVSWQAVRCYASGGSLSRTEVYERIKQLLAGFDKVGFIGSPLACFEHFRRGVSGITGQFSPCQNGSLGL